MIDVLNILISYSVGSLVKGWLITKWKCAFVGKYLISELYGKQTNKDIPHVRIPCRCQCTQLITQRVVKDSCYIVQACCNLTLNVTYQCMCA